MSALPQMSVPSPLRFQIGARTLGSIQRNLVRVPLDLADVLGGRLPMLPPLDAAADGYQVTSLPADRQEAMGFVGAGMIAFVRQTYVRYYADLSIGYDRYLETLSGNTRNGLKRKTKKIAGLSGGTLDVRAFRTPDELVAFHEVARGISARTYQEKLLGSGLPEDGGFLQRMYAMAAADQVRAWLLYVGGEPAAYLYCPIHDGTVIYQFVGHDPAFGDLSPGSVLHLAAMRDLQDEGNLTRFDFTEGEGQHKRQLSTGGVACVDLLLLRRSIANRATITALGTFDGGTALAKTLVQKYGLGDLARKIRRA
ncbi:GNAT family N-acetyltransferase [Sphingomonas sp. GB1N7]|uniref:GNAT family N-acetyltransferase n=1 Tax=Parasphingomonas caseinilytica TaxID=3096158 RepID=UPI002FC8F84E